MVSYHLRFNNSVWELARLTGPVEKFETEVIGTFSKKEEAEYAFLAFSQRDSLTVEVDKIEITGDPGRHGHWKVIEISFSHGTDISGIPGERRAKITIEDRASSPLAWVDPVCINAE